MKSDQSEFNDQSAAKECEILCRCGARIWEHGGCATWLPCPICGTPLSLDGSIAPSPATRAGILVPLDRTLEEPLRRTEEVANRPVRRSIEWAALSRRVLAVITGASLMRAIRGRLTTTRLIAGLVILLLLTTGWWSWHGYRYRQALAQLVANTEIGARALDEGRLHEGVQLLNKAAQAARIVGQQDPLARRAVQLHREAELWWRLTPTSVTSFFDQHSLANVATTQTEFASQLVGRTMIFDGWIQVLPKPTGTTAAEAKTDAPQAAVRFDWTWQSAGNQIEIWLDDARPFASCGDDETRRVIFGGQLEGLEQVSPGGTLWRVRIDPASITLLTAAGPFRGYQWPDAEEWLPVLARQRQGLGIEE